MIQPFKLEVYLAKYEFSAPYLLCCSDAESFSMQEILDLASPEDAKLWNNLHLGYTQDQGMPELRETIAKELYSGLKAEDILCFSGAEDGILCALKYLCQPSDHAIVLTPCYQSLAEIPHNQGCSVTELELKEDEAWRINLEEIKNAIKPNTKIVIINFPHNPTGQVIEQGELDGLVEICREHDLWLFSDEVYRLLGEPNTPWVKPAACCYEKALSLGVMSKAFGMAGLRIGWIACQNKEALQEIKQIKHYTTICNSAPAEILSLIALKNKDKILARNNEIVAGNLKLLDDFFAEEEERFSWVRPEGGCVGFVEYKGNEPVDTFCTNLVEETGVLLLPAQVYDVGTSHFRIGFGRKNMPEALERLKKFLNK